MPFVWLEADHEPGPASIRSYLERNSIGLLSAATTIDPPSVEWFGRHAADENIRKSGLWNVNYVDDTYDSAFLAAFEKLAIGQRSQPFRQSPAAAPAVEPERRFAAVSAGRNTEGMPVLALISCTKKKADHPCGAAELYSPSTFFRMAFELSNRVAGSTMILSAKYGLVHPKQVLEPYEQSLVGASRDERRRWAASVHEQLLASPEYKAAGTVIWFAGDSYRADLLPMVLRDGKECEVPMQRLAQGEQLAWLRQHLGRGDDALATAPVAPREVPQAIVAPAVPMSPDRHESSLSDALAKAMSWLRTTFGSCADRDVQATFPESSPPVGASSVAAPSRMTPEPGHNPVVRKSMPNADDFRRELGTLKTAAADRGQLELVLTAGDLHRRAGGYPGPNHRMPVCCSVMRQEMSPEDRIIAEPPKGAGASLQILYRWT